MRTVDDTISAEYLQFSKCMQIFFSFSVVAENEAIETRLLCKLIKLVKWD